MPTLMSMLPTLFRVLSPFIGKRVVGFLADYLNERRQAQSAPDSTFELPETIDPALLEELCPPPPKVEPRIIFKTSGWHLLSSGLVGAGLTIIIGLILFKR